MKYYVPQHRNGQEVKIDILDDGIRTPEVIRNVSGTYRSTGGVTGTPGGNIWATWAMGGEHTSPQGVAHPLMAGVRIGEGKEVAPLSYSLSLSFLPPLFLGGESY